MAMGAQIVKDAQFGSDKTTPFISVILPAFNAERYVREAVQSILAQTFTDFELIVIDDGSRDGTKAVIEALLEQDSRIILVSRENKGLVESLNEGIDLARGEWIARMDADDIAVPSRFERQLQWMAETNADLCGSWAKIFGTSDNMVIKHARSDEAIKMELLFGSPFVHPSVMMRKTLVKQLRYDQAWEKAEDYDLWERAASAGWTMGNVPEVLLLYRQHETQISTTASAKQQEMTQAIRRRYWRSVADSAGMDRAAIDEVLKLREPSPPKFDMDKIDAIFIELLDRSHGEARETVFDHVTRLYFRAASDCADAAFRWNRLNKKFGRGAAWLTRFRLLALSILRVRADSAFFMRLKKYYFSLTRST
jgi:glycosyltransferase involved in cell wall biosynthesis